MGLYLRGGLSVVSAPPSAPAKPSAVVTVGPTCTVPTATIVVSTASTGADLLYALDGGIYQSPATFSGVAAGTHTVTVRNAGGCISEAGKFISQCAACRPGQAECPGDGGAPTCTVPTATIVVSTTTTGTDLLYALDGGSYQSAATFSGVAAGTHLVTVKNASGCISEAGSVLVSAPPSAPAKPSAVVTVGPTCTVPTATIVVSTASTGADLLYSLDGGTYQSAATFSGVAAGTHVVTVKNASGCISEAGSVLVSAPPSAPAKPSAVVTVGPTCTVPTATIVVSTASTGADLLYSLDGGTYQSAATFSGVAAGTHVVTVKNASGCISEAGSVLVSAPPSAPAKPSAVVTVGPTCTVPTATIVVSTASTGADLLYSLDGGTYQSAATFSGVAAGTHVVTVKNASGCISEAGSVLVSAPPSAPAKPSAVVTVGPTCTVPTATIVVSTASTGADLLYSLDGGTYQSAATFSGVAAGTHVVTVKNASGCISEAGSVLVSAPPSAPAKPSAVVTVGPTCTVPTATIVVSTASTGADLLYSLDGGTYQSAATFSGVAAGTHVVTVKNASGCISEAGSVLVSAPPSAPAKPSAVVTVGPTCTVPTATIVVSTASTGADLLYSLDGGTYQSAATFSGVAAGTHVVTVKNASGCISEAGSVLVSAPPSAPAKPSAVVTVGPTCTVPTATIVVSTASTGADLLYSLDGGTYQSAATFSGVAAGTHVVTVKNASGCISEAGSVLVSAPPSAPAKPSAVVTVGPTCTVPTATIVVSTASTGADLLYSLDGGTYQSAATFSGVAAGTHVVTVKNASGCISEAGSVLVSAPPSAPAKPSAVVTVGPTCTVPTATIVVSTASTGADLLYSLDGGTYQSAATFSGVAAGTHVVTVKNASGCISEAGSVLVSAPPSAPAKPSAVVTVGPTCTVPTATIVVSTASTGADLLYSLDGGTYQSAATFSGVAAGTHVVTVKNASGCISEAGSVLVSAPPSAPVGIITPTTGTICNGGTQLLTTSGGTSYQWQKDGQAIAGATNASYNVTSAGTYSVIISNGSCSTQASNSAVVTVAQAPNLTINNPNAICTGNTYNLKTASLTAGSAPNLTFTYWTDANATSSLSNPESVGAGTYYIKATNTAGCFAIKPVEVKVSSTAIGSITPAIAPLNCSGTPVTLTASNSTSYQWYKNDTLIAGATERIYRATSEGVYNVMLNNGACTGKSSNAVNIQFQECIPVAQPDVFVPTAFTPNGNNANDVLKPILNSIRELNYFKVFNRWGQMVYQTNVIGEGWNGSVKGVLQPTETYSWIVECIDVDGNVIKKSGRSILIR